MSAFFTGLASGFQDARSAYEKEQFARAQAASQQEAEVYKTLLQSDRPEIQNMALAGLLESAQGPQKAKGIRGWLGQMQQSPTYQRMQALIAQPDVQTETTLPSIQGIPPASTAIAPAPIQSGILQPKEGAPAALPEGNKVEAGASGPPPALTSVASPGVTTTTVGPPKPIFLSPEAKLVAGARAKGLAAGLTTQAEAEAVGRAIRNSGGTAEEAKEAMLIKLGVLPKAKSPTATQLRDQFGGNVLGSNITPEEWTASGHTEAIDPTQTYRRMLSASGQSKFFPIDAQPSNVPHMTTLADPNTGQGYRVLLEPDGQGGWHWSPLGPVPATLRYLQRVDPDGTVTYLPVNPAARPLAPTAGIQGTAPPPAPGSATSAPPPTPVAGGRVVTPPLMPNAGAPPKPVGRGATPAAAARAAVPSGIPGGQRPVNYQTIPAAILDASGQLQVVQANRNPRTNALTDGASGQPLQGAMRITESQAAAIRGQQQLQGQMAEIDTLAQKVLPSIKDWAGGYATGPRMLVWRAMNKQAALDYDKLQVAVTNATGAVLQIQSQVGNKSDKDFEHARTALADLSNSLKGGDTVEQVQSRLEETKKALTLAQQSFVTQLQAAQTAAPTAGGPPAPALDEQLRDLKPGFARRINGVEYGRHPDGTIFPTGK